MRLSMLDIAKARAHASPVRLAFVGSLLLSLIAIAGTVTVGKDAAHYLDVARQALDRGPAVAFQLFTWPWFPLLLAATHSLLGIPLELAAYLWCALLMAGTCALMVAITQRLVTGSGYWACLVVLSIPACNHLRYDIIREFGFWFFCTLALWLALDWLRHGGWRRAIAVQAAIAAAALFRLEAVFLFAALTLCLLPEFRARQTWLQLLQINVLPLAAMLAALVLLLAGQELAQPRVAHFLSLLDPRNFLARFDLMAGDFAQAALRKNSATDAPQIVFFGLVFTLLVKFLTLSGPLALPLLYRGNWPVLGEYWRKLRPLAWAWFLYFGILLLFFIQERFVNSRYVSFLNLLAVPLLSLSLLRFAPRFPRLAKLLVALALLVMLHNVVSFAAKKTHYLEAGAWLAQNTAPADLIFYDDSRLAYYAGRGYPFMPVTREQAMTMENSPKYRYFAIVARPDEPALQLWMTQQQKRILGHFANRKGDTVLIVGD
jgi:hypothetical protein